MLYLAQAAAFTYVIWASIYYEWDAGPYAPGIVAMFAALLVTAIIIEIKLLPSRFARVHKRIFGLKDEPTGEITRLPRSTRHGDNPLEYRPGFRIGKDPS